MGFPKSENPLLENYTTGLDPILNIAALHFKIMI